jgi:hypothetical protein
LREKSDYVSPEVGTVFPLNSKYSEDVGLDFVKKIAYILENEGLIDSYMIPASQVERLEISFDAYVNKCPLRKNKEYWNDGIKQVSAFHPDSFLPFFMNESGSRLCRLCNGKQNIGSILKKLTQQYRVSQETLFEDVLKFLFLLEELDLIEFRG